MLYALALEGINIPLLPLIRERHCKMLYALSLGRIIKRDSGINFRDSGWFTIIQRSNIFEPFNS